MKIMQLKSKTTSVDPVNPVDQSSTCTSSLQKGLILCKVKNRTFFFYKVRIKGLKDRIPSSVKKICLKIPSYFSLPSVTIVKKFFFVVKQLLMSFSSKFKVWTLKTKKNINRKQSYGKKSNFHVKHEHLDYTIYQF